MIIQGDSHEWTLTLLNAAGTALNLANYTVTVTYKQQRYSNEPALFTHFIVFNGAGAVTSSSGMTVGGGGAAAGIITEKCTPTESALFAPKKYWGEVEVRVGSDVYTPLREIEDTVVADYT